MVSTEVEARELTRLKKMMKDPAYWRDRDPAIVKAVTQGFEDLYDDPQDRDDLEDLPDARQGQMANILGLNGQGNKEDTYIAHLTPGEIVVPLSAQTEQVMALLSQTLGEDLPTYTVGSGKEQINPESGLPAFADKGYDCDAAKDKQKKLQAEYNLIQANVERLERKLEKEKDEFEKEYIQEELDGARKALKNKRRQCQKLYDEMGEHRCGRYVFHFD